MLVPADFRHNTSQFREFTMKSLYFTCLGCLKWTNKILIPYVSVSFSASELCSLTITFIQIKYSDISRIHIGYLYVGCTRLFLNVIKSLRCKLYARKIDINDICSHLLHLICLWSLIYPAWAWKRLFQGQIYSLSHSNRIGLSVVQNKVTFLTRSWAVFIISGL